MTFFASVWCKCTDRTGTCHCENRTDHADLRTIMKAGHVLSLACKLQYGGGKERKGDKWARISSVASWQTWSWRRQWVLTFGLWWLPLTQVILLNIKCRQMEKSGCSNHEQWSLSTNPGSKMISQANASCCLLLIRGSFQK